MVLIVFISVIVSLVWVVSVCIEWLEVFCSVRIVGSSIYGVSIIGKVFDEIDLSVVSICGDSVNVMVLIICEDGLLMFSVLVICSRF